MTAASRFRHGDVAAAVYSEVMPAGATPGPCALVIFGASGDLTRRKLFPALYHLSREGLLPEAFAVVGVSRSPSTHEEFRARLREWLSVDEQPTFDRKAADALLSRAYYLAGDAQQAGCQERLRVFLGELDARHGTRGNALLYLATAPQLFGPIVEAAGKAGLLREQGGWRRVVIEKPFGRDAQSARALNARLREAVEESQIYRIDHYLGKETVQNIMALRFANGIFEPLWNRGYVDHVQITMAESLGTEGRGAYYDRSGALRDMVPNHLFQLVTLTAMEPPVSFDADAVHDEQMKVLRALQRLSETEALSSVVRGQYEGYRGEKGVGAGSATETFVAMRLLIDSWRWADVPFYVRTGKSLPCRSTEIVVQFKRVPFALFRQADIERVHRNQLILRIQPNEGIALSFEAKVPGPALRLDTVDMDFRYQDHFGQKPSTGYERLLLDAMLGDATLFQRADMVEAAWDFVAPIQRAWARTPPSFPNYGPGTWGPPAAEEMITSTGRHWRACAA